MKVCVIGAGIIGLSLAHYLGEEHDVTVLEKEPETGGLARPFTHQGQRYDKYYHFIFLNDHHTLNLMQELGIADKVRWEKPKMSLSLNGQLYPFSTPGDLLRLPLLSIFDKIRFVFGTKYISFIRRWKSLEQKKGLNWLRKIYGAKTTDILWKPLMIKKFRKHYTEVNAAWSWNEIFRRSKSRKAFGRETLGYYEGGVQTLIEALEKSIIGNGNAIKLNVDIKSINKKQDKIAITTAKGMEDYDLVFSTIPARALNHCLADEEKIPTKNISYLSIRCAVFILKKPLTDNFWLNINDEKTPQVVVVEFSNLANVPHHVVYVPYYTVFQDEQYSMSDAEFKELNMAFLQKINPNLHEQDIEAFYSFKNSYAHAIFDENYSEKIDSYQTAIPGLFSTNQSQIYPERSGVNESIRFAKRIYENYQSGLNTIYYFTAG